MIRFKAFSEGLRPMSNRIRHWADIPRRDPAPLQSRVGALVKGAILKTLQSGGPPGAPFPPRSSASLDIDGPGPVLGGVSGRIARGLRVEIQGKSVVVSSPVFPLSQVGGRTSPRSALPNRVIPKRVIAVIPDGTAARIVREVRVHYFEE